MHMLKGNVKCCLWSENCQFQQVLLKSPGRPVSLCTVNWARQLVNVRTRRGWNVLASVTVWIHTQRNAMRAIKKKIKIKALCGEHTRGKLLEMHSSFRTLALTTLADCHCCDPRKNHWMFCSTQQISFSMSKKLYTQYTQNSPQRTFVHYTEPAKSNESKSSIKSTSKVWKRLSPHL